MARRRASKSTSFSKKSSSRGLDSFIVATNKARGITSVQTLESIAKNPPITKTIFGSPINTKPIRISDFIKKPIPSSSVSTVSRLREPRPQIKRSPKVIIPFRRTSESTKPKVTTPIRQRRVSKSERVSQRNKGTRKSAPTSRSQPTPPAQEPLSVVQTTPRQRNTKTASASKFNFDSILDSLPLLGAIFIAILIIPRLIKKI